MARLPTPADFYTPNGYSREESVGYLMRRITLSIVQHADKRLGGHGLTSAQCWPLFKIQQGLCKTVADLARDLEMDAGAMTRLLDRLEKKGLCKRVRSTEDRRVVNIELTPEGEASIAEVPTVLAETLNAHLAGFSKTEWQALRSYLNRMLINGEALREADEAESQDSSK